MGMITTTKGMMEADDLERKDTVFEDDNELTQAIEYYLDGELVHRSVHVQLKRHVSAVPEAAAIG